MLMVIVIRVKRIHRYLLADAYGFICNLTQIYSTLGTQEAGNLRVIARKLPKTKMIRREAQ